MNVIELLITNKIADNEFRADAIATGIKAWECKTEEEILTRARLYREWRNSKIYKTTPVKDMFTPPTMKGEMADAQMDENINGEFMKWSG